MNDKFESKIINSRVAQNNKDGLRNSPAITCPHYKYMGRLEFDHFARSYFIGQLDSPSFNQRFLKRQIPAKNNER